MLSNDDLSWPPIITVGLDDCIRWELQSNRTGREFIRLAYTRGRAVQWYLPDAHEVVQYTRLDVSAVSSWHWRPRGFLETSWFSVHIKRPRCWILTSGKDTGSSKRIDALPGTPGVPGTEFGTTELVLKESIPVNLVWDTELEQFVPLLSHQNIARL